MEKPETRVYKSVDGLDIKLDIYRSSNSEKSARPAVMFIHGGGLIAGARNNLLPSHVETFNRNGFDFVSIDYRLAPETKLPGIVADIRDAWIWLQENALELGIDPDRIAVMGHSAGGYLALVGGFRFEPRPVAVVSIAGYGNLLDETFVTPSQHYLDVREPVSEEEAQRTVGVTPISETAPTDSMQWFTGRGLFYLAHRQKGDWLNVVSGHNPEDSDWFRPYMPTANVSADYPPTMLLHGEPDTDVSINQSELMQKFLAEHGVAHEFLRNPNWQHAFLYVPTDKTVESAFEEIVRFVNDQLQ